MPSPRDVLMPTMNGAVFVENLRRLDANRALRVIVPTANPQSAPAARLASHDVLEKPVDVRVRSCGGTCVKTPQAAVVLVSETIDGDNCAMSSVMVIEDDDDLRAELCRVLADEGYATSSAPNGQEALALLEKRERPDLIVLDLMMPVMNGWQFRERQLGDARLASIPVLVMTAAAGLDKSVIDATDFALKPIALEDFIERVRHFAGATEFDHEPKTTRDDGIVMAELALGDSPPPK